MKKATKILLIATIVLWTIIPLLESKTPIMPIISVIGFYAILAFILRKPIKAFINWTKYWSEKE